MLAKNLVAAAIKRGGTAELVERDLKHALCTKCGASLTHHNVLNMSGPDYMAWLPDDAEAWDCTDGGKHEPTKSYEVAGILGNYDVHAFCQPDWQTGKPSFSSYTVRHTSKRGEYDPYSDYNPGGYTFCSRLADLDWACR